MVLIYWTSGYYTFYISKQQLTFISKGTQLFGNSNKLELIEAMSSGWVISALGIILTFAAISVFTQLGHIAETLNSQNYARLRFGIGNNYKIGRQSDYVLSTWDSSENDIFLWPMYKFLNKYY